VEVTEVRIKLMEGSEDRLRAFCSITLDHCFVIRDLKIIDGASGPFVAMPSRKLSSHCYRCHYKNHLRAAFCNQCGSKLKVPHPSESPQKLYADVAHPVNSECRERISAAVLTEFENELARSVEPGYRSRYDDEFEAISESTDDFFHFGGYGKVASKPPTEPPPAPDPGTNHRPANHRPADRRLPPETTPPPQAHREISREPHREPQREPNRDAYRETHRELNRESQRDTPPAPPASSVAPPHPASPRSTSGESSPGPATRPAANPLSSEPTPYRDPPKPPTSRGESPASIRTADIPTSNRPSPRPTDGFGAGIFD
jgi:stage V sporulation protein G